MLRKNENGKQEDQLSFLYDEKHDILYVSVNDPKECYSEEILPGVFLRRQLDNDEINGLTILNLKSQSNAIVKLPLLMDAFDVKQLSKYLCH